MGNAWSEFVGGSSESSPHGVQVYADLAELAESVGAYLVAGFERGEPAVVVATRGHRARFAEQLAAVGWPAERVEQAGLLLDADADDTLAAIMSGDEPSAEAFERIVGGLLDEAERRAPGKHVRVFGEMVDVLCRRGRADAATALEELWNALGRARSFSLLCGYELDVFDRTTQAGLLGEVCRLHSHVQPVLDPARLTRAVDLALEEVLGAAEAGKVYLLLAPEIRRARVPLGQLVLMWVSEHMPVSSERVLASARARYAQAG